MEIAKGMPFGEDKQRALHGIKVEQKDPFDLDRVFQWDQPFPESRRPGALQRLMEAGRAERGAEYAGEVIRKAEHEVRSADPSIKVWGLLEICEVQRKAGETEALKNTLAEALQAAREVAIDWPIDVPFVREVGMEYARAGYAGIAADVFEEAIAGLPATKAGFEGLMIDAQLARIAEAQAEAGLRHEALATARRIGPVRSRLFEEGYFLEGGPSFDTWPSDEEMKAYYGKCEQMRAIGFIELISGDVAAILGASPRDERVFDDVLLLEAVQSCVTRKDLARAEAICDGMGDSEYRAEALLTVAIVYAEAGQERKAIDLADRTRHRPRHVDVLDWRVSTFFNWRLPQSWARTYDAPGLPIAALRLQQILGVRAEGEYAAAFQNCFPSMLRALGRTHAERGDPHEALEWCLKIKDPDRRFNALLGLTEGITGGPIYP
jgi:tetratricopeptide (TPR) repeat protein